MGPATTRVWRNWGRVASCVPRRVERPRTEEEIVRAVRVAADEGVRVKAAGSGHSFTDIACTDGVLLSLDRYDRVLGVDRDRRTVTVQAGITLRALNDRLAEHGFALENLGDIAYQTVAGAISTATHGTGLGFGNLSTQVTAMRLVTADGATLDCDGVLRAARVSLGALGVISTVTLRCVDAFGLRAVEGPERLDDLLPALDDLAAGSDHAEFFWFPHTDRVLVKRNTRTAPPTSAPSRIATFVDDLVMENGVFGLACRLGRRRPAWIPRINRLLVAGLRGSEAVKRSDHGFASPRLVRFAEMEYAVPRERAADAVRGVRSVIEDRGYRIGFPVEVRFVAADDAFLSPSYGRESCYVAVHVYRGMPYEPYFRAVEQVMVGLGGRPHWGKLHFRTAADLRGVYPRWDEFAAVRERLDPQRRFANAYLDRVLSP